jgi:hypothetical protein
MRRFWVVMFCLASLAVVAQTKPRPATLAQQKMCADQARKTFDKDYAGQNADFTSHYDPKVNVCYIMIHVFPKAGEMAWSEVVFDAFELRVYASIIWDNPEHKKYWEVVPLECYIKPVGSDKAFCHSADEFEALIDKHFGIGR